MGGDGNWNFEDTVGTAISVRKFSNTPYFLVKNAATTGAWSASIKGGSATATSLFMWTTLASAGGPNYNCIVPGSTAYVEYLSMRYTVHLRRNFDATGGYPETVRLIIFLQKNAKDDTFAFSDFFGSTMYSESSTLKTTYEGPKNEAQDSIVVLRDVRLYFPPIAASGAHTGFLPLVAQGDDIMVTDVIDLRGIKSVLRACDSPSGFMPATNKICAVIMCGAERGTNSGLEADYTARLFWRSG